MGEDGEDRKIRKFFSVGGESCFENFSSLVLTQRKNREMKVRKEICLIFENVIVNRILKMYIKSSLINF